MTQQLAQVGVHVADWNQVKRARNAPTTPRRIPKGQVSSYSSQLRPAVLVLVSLDCV